MEEKELAFLLTRNGIVSQRLDSENYTEANADDKIRDAGNASVANSLEFLGKHQIVLDVQPTFGSYGIGFVYRINPKLVNDLKDDESISKIVLNLFEPQDEASKTIAELIDICLGKEINNVYKDDFIASLKELKVCFNNRCFIACLSLSGKILEICLKQLLIDNNIQFEDKFMIGQLLNKIKEAKIEKYLDQSLLEVAAIINKSRIPAVHAKEKIPVPSREQAAMVIHGVVDTINRTILYP
jgi:hypothetical protein